MTLEKYIMEVADILKRKIRSFNTILELLILEEKCLIECDTGSLTTVLERQEDVFSSIACLDKSRMDILAKIAEFLDCEDSESLTVSKLVEQVEEPIKRELLESGHILSSIHEDIQRKKFSNNLLIKQAIMLVESDIRLILNAVYKMKNSEAVYTSQAGSKRSSQNVCLDEKL